jgi:K+/H+ antiporter YhaU regulatory subunit KhtT
LGLKVRREPLRCTAAILRQPEPVAGAQLSDTIERGDTLVTAGKAGQYARFRRLLSGTEQ